MCKDFNVRAVYKSGLTLRSLLTPPTEKEANVVCEIDSTFERYTLVRLHVDSKHKDACIEGFNHGQVCHIAEHACMEDYPMLWDDCMILQHAS